MKILHAIHDFLPRHRAGSELYAFHLCRELQRSHQVEVLCAEYDPSRPHGSTLRREHEGLTVHEVVNNWAFPSFNDTYRSSKLNQVLEGVLAEVRPDVLHVHNLLNLSLDLPRLARERGIPTVATLHDYTLVCPSGGQRVHLAEEHVCERIDPVRCARCYAQSPFHAQQAATALPLSPRALGAARQALRALSRPFPRSTALATAFLQSLPTSTVRAREIEGRLEHVRGVFEQVALFVAPSPSLADEYLKLGLPRAKLRVSDYGFPSAPALPRARAPRQRLQVGFVGTLAWHKGAHVLLEAARHLPPERFELQIHGALETFPPYVESLRRAAEGLPVTFHGGFSSPQAAEVYGGLDVLVVSSLWPENSPLVIHEAYQAGVPVIGARMGGIRDLVTHGVNGLLYEATSARALSDALRTVLDSPQLLSDFAAKLPKVKSIDQDREEWESRYREVRQVA